MAGEEHIIDLKHVSKRFGDKFVLDDISLYIRKGEFVTLLGPSGCGKTTTLRLISGFLAPDEGEILLDGKDISGIPPYKRPFNTVFQRYALFPHLDVYENIAFGLKLQKVPEDEIEKRVKRVLKLVSMSDYEPSPAHWSTSRRSCCSTNPSPPLTSRCARTCRSSSRRCTRSWASPLST